MGLLRHLVRKELLHYLHDSRFLIVSALCVLLCAVSTYAGLVNYERQLDGYSAVSEKNRSAVDQMKSHLMGSDLTMRGFRWNRRPEVLSTIVYGFSGALGQEVLIQYRRYPRFEASRFSTDPIEGLFGILDVAFVVKVVLSLCMLLFTYDAVCGEKEAGTLRLYASFPVSRSWLAASKLTGATLAVLIPYLAIALTVSIVLALSPVAGLTGVDWLRAGILFLLFGLYLVAYAAFGLWGSALTQRRRTSFLWLLGLWTLWTFVAPNLAVGAARHISSAKSVYAFDRRTTVLREELRTEVEREEAAYWERNGPEDWDALSKAQQEVLLAGDARINERWDQQFYERLKGLQEEWQNQERRERTLAMVLSAVSPLGAVSYATLDVARTGFRQQEDVEDAVNAYLSYMAKYIQDRRRVHWDDRTLTDFVPFNYVASEHLGEVASRNVWHVLNLALFAALGFAGAFVALLRYDVR